MPNPAKNYYVFDKIELLKFGHEGLKSNRGYDILSRLMSKQKLKSNLPLYSLTARKFVLVVMAVVLGLGTALTIKVSADQFDQKINSLEQQNAGKQDAVAQLEEKANSYQDAINKLQAQISSLQSSIDANHAKQAKLNQQIIEAQAELDKQKQILGESVRAIYVGGQVTTLEMLASSNNLSDFVDKQVYQSTVQDKVKTALDEVTALKLKLQDQKNEVEQLLIDLQTQQSQLSEAKSKQDQLLSYNQSQQDSFNKQIQANQSKIADLRAQQAAINAQHFLGYTIVAGHNGRDTYPNTWRNAPQDSMIDAWGMFNRECVSYTAWKVASSGRHMPYWGGSGNANQWPDNARAAGIPVSSSPRAGDIAIAYWGSFGHAMHVDSVNDDGTINISQYNWDYHGTYSEIYHFNTSGLVFIHF